MWGYLLCIHLTLSVQPPDVPHSNKAPAQCSVARVGMRGKGHLRQLIAGQRAVCLLAILAIAPGIRQQAYGDKRHA